MVVTRRQAALAGTSPADGKMAERTTTDVNPDDEPAGGARAATASNGTVKIPSKHEPTPYWVYLLLLSFAVVTFTTRPVPFHPLHGEEPTIRHVFFYGWLTAISTGLGVLPFFFIPRVAMYWVGISNGTRTSVCIFLF